LHRISIDFEYSPEFPGFDDKNIRYHLNSLSFNLPAHTFKLY